MSQRDVRGFNNNAVLQILWNREGSISRHQRFGPCVAFPEDVDEKESAESNFVRHLDIE